MRTNGWQTVLLVVSVTTFPACGDTTDTDVSGRCAAILAVGEALDGVRAAAGDRLDAAAGFDSAAGAFDRTAPPADLSADWASAATALRYYAASAAGPQTPMRSDTEVQGWRQAFGRITGIGIDECGLGWRTPFDDCRQGAPPGDATETRILFPCAP